MGKPGDDQSGRGAALGRAGRSSPNVQATMARSREAVQYGLAWRSVEDGERRERNAAGDPAGAVWAAASSALEVRLAEHARCGCHQCQTHTQA
jgi:hypothetical protein